MQFFAATVFFVACSPASASVTNPVAKVLDLISGLQSKIISEGEAAQKVYNDFAEFCEDTSKNIAYDIDTHKHNVADLKATIAEELATIDALNTKVDELAESIATDSADLKAATQIRNTEAVDFALEEKDLTEAIDTLQRAVSILEREMQKGGAAAMLQVKNAGTLAQALGAMVQASLLGSADATRLTALVQSAQEDGDGDDESGAPDASVYAGHSSNIIDTLGDLLDKAQAQLSEARHKEQTALNNFQMLKQSLDDQIKFSSRDTASAKKSTAEAAGIKAVAQGDLEVTSKDLAEDLKTQSTLHQDCMTKAEDFQGATKSRGEELTALAMAKKVISEATSGGIAASQTYGLLQLSFVQIRRLQLSSTTDLAKFEAVRYIRDLAIKENSPALSQLASRMSSAMRLSASAGSDPFAKVKGLLSDMLDRLQNEAAADATQQSYCVKEMAESHAKEDDLTTDISKLSTKLDQMTARSAKLKEQVAALQKALAALAGEQVEMNNMRTKEHDLFTRNKPEMERGLEGIKTALQVLRTYYASDDKAHTAADGAGGGIIGLIEVCESDFSKGLAEMVSTEDNAAATYDQETKNNAVEKVTKEKDAEYKQKEAISLDKAVAQATSDRSGLQAELDAVWEYLKKLDEMCIAKPDSYAVKKGRRDAEIAGLKQALEILEGEAVLLQRKKRTLRGSVAIAL